MSKATNPPEETELPDGQIAFNLRQDSDKRQFAACQREIAEQRGTAPDDVGNIDVFRALAESFLSDAGQREVSRLLDDKRIQEAREVVAQDHSCEPEDVSLACLLKITAGAYTGFQQTSDWDLNGPATEGTHD